MKTNFNFEEIPLSELAPGRVGIVKSIDDEGPLGRRLLDLGFIPRTRVRMVRRAPLGDPLEFELRGYHLCLRSADAARIRVRGES